jgi:hypothetical protein
MEAVPTPDSSATAMPRPPLITRQAVTRGSLAFVICRLLVTLIMAAAAWFFPPQLAQVQSSYQVVGFAGYYAYGGSLAERLALQPWYRWDTINYLLIAEHGYNATESTAVWPPLYPALISAFSALTGNPLLAALLVSNLAAWVFCILLYGYTARYFSPELAGNTLTWFLVYPAAFFLVAGYSEAVFLTPALLSLAAARERKWLWAALLATLAALVRNQGLLLALPFLIWMLQDGFWPQLRRWRWLLPRLAALATAPAAFAGHALYVKLILGLDWPWVTLAARWKIHTDWPWAGLWGNFLSLTVHASQVQFSPYSRALDLVFALLALALLALLFRRLPLAEWAYAAAAMLMFLSKVTDSMMTTSVARYLLSLHVLFIGLAMLVRGKALRLLLFAVFAFSQIFLLVYFEMWGFVA